MPNDKPKNKCVDCGNLCHGVRCWICSVADKKARRGKTWGQLQRQTDSCVRRRKRKKLRV